MDGSRWSTPRPGSTARPRRCWPGLPRTGRPGPRTRNRATLYRYVPSAETRFPVPLLLVYALIDRPFILDPIPGNSFVEYLVKQGFDVYLLDWGIPGQEDRALSFDD